MSIINHTFRRSNGLDDNQLAVEAFNEFENCFDKITDSLEKYKTAFAYIQKLAMENDAPVLAMESFDAGVIAVIAVIVGAICTFLYKIYSIFFGDSTSSGGISSGTTSSGTTSSGTTSSGGISGGGLSYPAAKARTNHFRESASKVKSVNKRPSSDTDKRSIEDKRAEKAAMNLREYRDYWARSKSEDVSMIRMAALENLGAAAINNACSSAEKIVNVARQHKLFDIDKPLFTKGIEIAEKRIIGATTESLADFIDELETMNEDISTKYFVGHNVDKVSETISSVSNILSDSSFTEEHVINNFLNKVSQFTPETFSSELSKAEQYFSDDNLAAMERGKKDLEEITKVFQRVKNELAIISTITQNKNDKEASEYISLYKRYLQNLRQIIAISFSWLKVLSNPSEIQGKYYSEMCGYMITIYRGDKDLKDFVDACKALRSNLVAR